jgi:hypothetical protein
MFLFAAAMAASGQAISGPEQSQTPGEFQSEKSQMPQVRVIQHHDKLRRDRDERIVVFSVFPPSNSQTCPTQSAPCLYPFSLQLEPTEGFRFRFYSDRGGFKSRDQAHIVSTEGAMAFLLQVRAARNVPLGEHAIKGRLQFTVMGHPESSPEIEIVLPVTVVDHDAKVTENPWPFHTYPLHPVRLKVETALLIPLMPFLFALYVVSSHTGGW